MPKPRRHAGLIAIVVFLLITLLALVIWRSMISQAPAQLLIRDDQPAKGAAYIVLMMGDVMDRSPHAAKLYLEGYGKKIIFAEAEHNPMIQRGFRTPDGVASYQYLLELGVPAHDIVFLENSRNTSSEEEVSMIIEHIELHDQAATRLILVTSWYHSSRAYWILRRRNPTKLELQSSPSPAPENLWRDEQAFLAVYTEYLKWVYYLLRY